MLDSFTQFWFSHIDGILNVLFLILILLFLILFVVIFVSSKNKKTGVESLPDDLEKTLRKVLESAELKASPMPMPTGTVDNTKEASEEVEKLKKSIGEKTSEIETLKKQISEKQNSGSGEDVSGLQVRLKELEAKLAEYEIIEDDIANLSMYKEENKRLRSELEKLQGDEGPVTVSEPVAEITSAPEPIAESAPTPEPVAEPVAAQPEPEPAPEPVVATTPTPEAAPQATDDDDIMGEFVQAVAEQGTKEQPVETAKVAEAPQTPAAPVEETISTDDIMAEFEAAAAKAEEATKQPTADTITDDIMAEFQAAVEDKEKEKPKTEEVKASTSPLDENTDTDKILSEMDSLLTADTTPVAEEGDPSEKLISEFESLTNEKT